ncbi:P2Y purinoceptor 2-like [Hypanus sabinus]|uniref:P2Y purinoceptor 2-like n=1 Tax=Hypanus sabinus TaxID=79690 RepID=UPI0028C3C07A|nr:P2Y purinoceptor 2-like [Hypanus sabinus]XP_059819946.1 P2Y purinoceptor 2-like [Hypanus sabinus]XP_059819948.1 P2Y purinoceptor 2-like [Hypanus sabinus]XP_059819949.1 P2Y purinoceptor 2-like [Hypanus sabinus]XP_059819950.1 P2Y purinoceptor 2-like [Hypanus sabinus]
MTEPYERNSPNCTFNEDFKYIFLPVSYGIVFVVGLVLNALAIWVFVFRMRPWNITTTYMFNLALSDIMYDISLPLLIYYYAKHNDWPFGATLCKIVRFLFYTNLYCSILFLTCMSVHRFLGVCFPMHSLRWSNLRYTRIVCIVIWAVVIIFQTPIFGFVNTETVGNTTICYDTSNQKNFNKFVIYSAVQLVLLFCCPFTVVMICYGITAKNLLRPNDVRPEYARSRKKSIKMIITVLTVFVLCFLPFHITRSIYYSSRSLHVNCRTLEAVSLAYKLTRPLASANSCLDPILYVLAGQTYRSKLALKGNGAEKKQNHPSAQKTIDGMNITCSVYSTEIRLEKIKQGTGGSSDGV